MSGGKGGPIVRKGRAKDQLCLGLCVCLEHMGHTHEAAHGLKKKVCEIKR